MTQRPNMIDPALIPDSRYKVHKASASIYIVADSTTGNEIAAFTDYETADGQWTDDALNRAMTVAVCLNNAAWDYRPSFAE